MKVLAVLIVVVGLATVYCLDTNWIELEQKIEAEVDQEELKALKLIRFMSFAAKRTNPTSKEILTGLTSYVGSEVYSKEEDKMHCCKVEPVLKKVNDVCQRVMMKFGDGLKLVHTVFALNRSVSFTESRFYQDWSANYAVCKKLLDDYANLKAEIMKSMHI